MNRLLILAVASCGALLSAGPCFAQANTNSGASSNSMTNVYPSTVPTTANGQVATDPNGYSPYNTHSTVDQTGIPHQAPALALPSVYGLNPCSTGGSVGVTTPLFGIGGALSSTDKGCEARNNAALAISAFHNEMLARETLCVVDEWRAAWKRIGKPCLIDQASQPETSIQTGTGTAPQARPAAVPVGTMLMPAPEATPTQTFIPAKPDWCATVSPQEWRDNANIRHQCSG
jgi:hypothetical protein